MTHFMPSTRTLHFLDVALALWVTAWIALGVAIGINAHKLTTLSHTVAADGRAVQSIGHSLHTLGGVPFVGGTLEKDASQIEAAGAGTANGALQSASAIRVLSVLLAIAVALLPTVPVACLYLPARLQRRREAAALRRALHERGDDPEFVGFLARRATEALGYHQLRNISIAPWHELDESGCRRLAEAELTRLGIEPTVLPRARRSRA